MKNEKRYVVKIDLFEYASSDEEAIQKAEDLVAELNIRRDCKAEVLEIHEAKYGQMLNARKVK